METSPHRATRRTLLSAGGAMFSWAFMPRLASAANRDPRFVAIILRGALDGLSAVGPIGDPDYAGLHGRIALSSGGERPALPLDGFFALNPAMPVFHRMFQAKQATIVHAVATPYRDRSHFDGQDVLESGYPGPGRVDSGWLNRALAALPRGERLNAEAVQALGVGAAPPLVIRGPAPVVGWAPSALPSASDDLSRRLLDLYQHRDPVLARALSEGLGVERTVAQKIGGAPARGGSNSEAGMRQAAQGAAKLMAAPDGPRLAALAFDGWDTHANEGGAVGRLAQLLAGLDGAFDEFEKGLGAAAWKDTTIVAITEFGRTARINGTIGTDHGTGSVAFLAGGAVKGGRVIADWPGLGSSALYENRDLRATADLRAVLKGILAESFGLSAQTLGARVFPESSAVKPLSNLLNS